MTSDTVVGCGRVVCLALLLLIWPTGSTDAAALKNLVKYQELSDTEIAEAFYDTVFGSEDPTVGKLRAGTVRKYTKPIKYFVQGNGKARITPLEMMLESLTFIMPVVPVSAADRLNNADLRIFLVADDDAMVSKAKEIWGKNISREQIKFLKGLPCVTFLDYYGNSSRIRRSTILFALTNSDNHTECAFEEFIQALGPINDSRTSKKTLMNDASHFSQIPLLDLYIANMLYDPAIKPGMSKKQVRKVFPDVLARTRQKLEWLTQVIHQ